MSCPGVTAEVYPGATHLSHTACTSNAHAHVRRISTAHDCGAGSSIGKGKDPRAGGDCYFVWSVQCSQTSS